MVGHGGSSAGSYLADPTSRIPSHCASIVVTSTVRVNPEDTSLWAMEVHFLVHTLRMLLCKGTLLLTQESILNFLRYKFLYSIQFSSPWLFSRCFHNEEACPECSWLTQKFSNKFYAIIDHIRES